MAESTADDDNKKKVYHQKQCLFMKEMGENHGVAYWTCPKGTDREKMLHDFADEFCAGHTCYDKHGKKFTNIQQYRDKVADRFSSWKNRPANKEKLEAALSAAKASRGPPSSQSSKKPAARTALKAKLNNKTKNGKKGEDAVSVVSLESQDPPSFVDEAAKPPSKRKVNSGIGSKKSKVDDTQSVVSLEESENVDLFANVPHLLKKKLEHFAKFVESTKAQGRLKELAAQNDKSDESYTLVNQALQIFLTDNEAKGHAKAYKGLEELYPASKKKYFLSTEEWKQVALAMAVARDASLAARNCVNLALLVGYEGARGPQPTHVDTKHPLQGEAENFGILMLTKDCPGTIYYDMEGVSDLPTLEEIRNKAWKDAPASLWEAIENNEPALELIQECGRLLFATPGKRVEPGIVPQFHLTVLKGSHPHCAPACKKFRAVLFFTLGEGYDGDEQWSKEKLAFLLYEELNEDPGVRREAKRFLLEKFAEYFQESTGFGADDNTFKLPTHFQKLIQRLKNFTAVRGAKDEESQILAQELEEQIRLAQEKLRLKEKEREDIRKLQEDERDYLIDTILGNDHVEHVERLDNEDEENEGEED